MVMSHRVHGVLGCSHDREIFDFLHFLNTQVCGYKCKHECTLLRWYVRDQHNVEHNCQMENAWFQVCMVPNWSSMLVSQ